MFAIVSVELESGYDYHMIEINHDFSFVTSLFVFISGVDSIFILPYIIILGFLG